VLLNAAWLSEKKQIPMLNAKWKGQATTYKALHQNKKK
jgi:hypothetical protein